MGEEHSFHFRAGTCNFADGRVTPNNDKGVISLGITEDGLFHFLWTNRQTGSIDLDLIIFPDEAELKIAGPPTARVYVLKFKTTGQKNFFWLQESNAQEDGELVERIPLHLCPLLEVQPCTKILFQWI
ncbi:proteasome complex subunit Rpn13 ubiquitin receptor-domain-containing protein [Cladochytrium replicatum]|nr:proteasome complex subunit Rpn13 ubiquitin receptor-domain-containing protein [Cladochytrium replicatum]